MADPLSQFHSGGDVAPAVPQSTTSEASWTDWLSENAPWLSLGLTGAAAGATALLLKRPFIKDAVVNALKSTTKALPKELPLLKEMPQSPVISLTEKHAKEYASALEQAVSGPLEGVLRKKVTPAEFMDTEENAYRAWKSLGETPQAKKAAQTLYNPEQQKALTYWENELRPAEKTAAEYFGHSLDDINYPYWPRIAQQDVSNQVKIGGFVPGLRSDIRSTIGSFEKVREFPTMKVGVLAGEEYADPTLAALYRTHAGVKLVNTYNYIQDLEQAGVLYKDLEAAKAAGKAGEMIKVQGIPGSGTWYARSKIEAEFIKDQLQNPRTMGGLASISQQLNKVFRNPNLFNPLPHFTKNMLFKYGWSGGSMTQVFKDMGEYFNNANPALIAEFKKVMPFAEHGRTATDILIEAAALAKGSKFNNFLKLVETPNRWSSNLVFSKFDPGLRWSRWKQYVDKGMDYQEAANHVWIDLVRYGTRSDLVDFWKSIPFNFFVPWRIGTVTSMIKNAQSAPMRTALFLGGVDLMKEIIYRNTGWWFHTPSDYVEAPVARLIESMRKGPLRETGAIGSIASTTGLFGPGGTSADKLIRNTLDSMDKGSVDYKTFVNMFWGLAAVADPYGSLAKEVAGFVQDHEPQHLVKVLQSVAFGAHNALDYRPQRLMAYLPESLPFLKKSDVVESAEALQDRATFRKEIRKPYRTISERLGQ